MRCCNADLDLSGTFGFRKFFYRRDNFFAEIRWGKHRVEGDEHGIAHRTAGGFAGNGEYFYSWFFIYLGVGGKKMCPFVFKF